ncbi:hypothetical protein RIF29_28181 [Crotalaria pallida]|uniref:Uncharacterized protein n=1 Tax=Crotalaria pallida TaxID=3830 RepID=A0AAN9EY19_CROPI
MDIAESSGQRRSRGDNSVDIAIRQRPMVVKLPKGMAYFRGCTTPRDPSFFTVEVTKNYNHSKLITLFNKFSVVSRSTYILLGQGVGREEGGEGREEGGEGREEGGEGRVFLLYENGIPLASPLATATGTPPLATGTQRPPLSYPIKQKQCYAANELIQFAKFGRNTYYHRRRGIEDTEKALEKFWPMFRILAHHLLVSVTYNFDNWQLEKLH